MAKPNIEFSPTHVIKKGQETIALLMVNEYNFYTKEEWEAKKQPAWSITQAGIYNLDKPLTIEYQLFPIIRK